MASASLALSFSGEVNSEPCDAATETIGTTPADFIAFVAAVDGVQAEAPVDVTVGGRPAIQLDLTTESPCPGSGQMRVWTLPDGGFYFDGGEQARVYAVDAGSATVVIVIDVWSPTSDYAVLLQKADELIATLTITPAS